MALSLTQRWLKENAQSYPAHPRVYADLDAALARVPSLRPKSDVYTFDDGRTQLLLCLHGLLPIVFRAAHYHIPIALWIPRDYPRDAPIVYVVPTNDMLVKPGRHVDPSGRTTIDYIDHWHRKDEGCSVVALIDALQEQFSREPPVYAKPKSASAPQHKPAPPSKPPPTHRQSPSSSSPHHHSAPLLQGEASPAPPPPPPPPPPLSRPPVPPHPHPNPHPGPQSYVISSTLGPNYSTTPNNPTQNLGPNPPRFDLSAPAQPHGNQFQYAQAPAPSAATPLGQGHGLTQAPTPNAYYYPPSPNAHANGTAYPNADAQANSTSPTPSAHHALPNASAAQEYQARTAASTGYAPHVSQAQSPPPPPLPPHPNHQPRSNLNPSLHPRTPAYPLAFSASNSAAPNANPNAILSPLASPPPPPLPPLPPANQSRGQLGYQQQPPYVQQQQQQQQQQQYTQQQQYHASPAPFVGSAPKAPIPNLLDQDESPQQQPSSTFSPGHASQHQQQQQPTGPPTPFGAPAPPRPPNPELVTLHTAVHAKLTGALQALSASMAGDAERLRAVQADLLQGEPAVRDEMARLEAVRDVCVGVAGRVGACVREAEGRLGEVRRRRGSKDTEGDGEGEEESVDEIVCATSIVHNQLINLVADDNAIEDTIYHLHRALSAGRIDLEKFLRSARMLAEEQFMKRALIEKIQNNVAELAPLTPFAWA